MPSVTGYQLSQHPRGRNARTELDIMSRISIVNGLGLIGFLTLLSLVSGCGALDLCSNACEPGWSHYLDCTCEQNGTYTPRSGANGLPLSSDCICHNISSDGNYWAFFKYQPLSFGSRSPVRLSSNTCTDVTVCDSSYTTVHGTMTILDPHWGSRMNPVTGYTAWFVYGSRTAASLEQNYSPVPRHALASFLPVLIANAANNFHATIPTCKQECDAGGASCLRLVLPVELSKSLRTLKSALTFSPKIDESDMLQMFQVAGDPCKRGDTVEGLLQNVGQGACELTAEALGGLHVRVPEVLTGKVTHDGGTIAVTFDDAATRGFLLFDAAPIDKTWGGAITGFLRMTTILASQLGTHAAFVVNSIET
jgi:hypothetical protein